jgi:hypothetical protein
MWKAVLIKRVLIFVMCGNVEDLEKGKSVWKAVLIKRVLIFVMCGNVEDLERWWWFACVGIAMRWEKWWGVRM